MEPNFELSNGPAPAGPLSPSIPLPSDAALPALGPLRAVGLAGALPGLGLGDLPTELRLCNYVPGSRATFEARAGNRRFALKLYADDATAEVTLLRKLARMGLAREFGARVPRVLTWDHDLRILVMTWFEGSTANHLVKEGKGTRAGQLAASWLWHATARRVRLGPPRGRGHMLYQAGVSAGALGTADPALGAAAKRVAKMLVRTQIREKAPCLVHGTLYARHIFDLDGSPGVIDWNQFGQGPVELDAGMFLATISRFAHRHEPFAAEANRATETFLGRIQNLVDPRTLEWYWAAGLLHLAGRKIKTNPNSPAAPEARAVLDEAARHAQLAARSDSIASEDARHGLARIRFRLGAQARNRKGALNPVRPIGRRVEAGSDSAVAKADEGAER